VSAFLRLEKNSQKLINEKIKSALFMLFHIEGNSRWATKFNSQMMKCHEKIDSNIRSNFESDIMVILDEDNATMSDQNEDE
jgi:hypothetical protein